MSVTFSVADAPTEKVTKDCEACDGAGVESINGIPYSCLYCNGTGKYDTFDYVAPFFDINLANSNASDFLRLLDPEHTFGDIAGEWPVARLPRIASNILRARNIAAEKVGMLLPPERQGNFIMCGRDAEYVQRRLAQFHDLVKLAMEHGKPIHFA